MATKPNIPTVTIRRLAKKEYEVEAPGQHQTFYIRQEKHDWVVDIFNSSVKNTEDAYIQSEVLYTSRQTQPNWTIIFQHLNLL